MDIIFIRLNSIFKYFLKFNRKVKLINWFIFLVIIGLISIKVYYLNLSYLNNSYSNEVAYNSGDSSHYLMIAKNISDYNVYSDTNSKIVSEVATWRPPFWPLILSILFKFSSNPLYLIILKSILEIGLMLFALFKLKKNLNLNLVYLLPFFTIFIEPQYLKYSITFLSESFTAILILLLLAYFLTLNNIKRYHISIPILASIIILTHPVSLFFVVSIFIIYLLYNLKSNFRITILHGLLFSIIILVWPIRNNITFEKGFYLTASQGATFSKGWNENVSTQFTNVDGDLANEGLNLKYVDSTSIAEINNSVLNLSKVYVIGTKNFINKISFREKINIIFVKIKSNFNPFPEKSKPGFLESVSILFRIMYLIVFIQLIVRLFRIQRFNFNTINDRVFLIVTAVFIGQILMSSYIYTGLRFNSIYSLTMLCCFIILNLKIIIPMINYINNIIFHKFNL